MNDYNLQIKLNLLHEEDLNDKYKNKFWINHFHICDYELIGKITSKDKKWAKQKCKKFLKKYNMKRDKCYDCCDKCVHMRYVEITDNSMVNIFSIGIDAPYINQDMVNDLKHEWGNTNGEL